MGGLSHIDLWFDPASAPIPIPFPIPNLVGEGDRKSDRYRLKGGFSTTPSC
jgi:hypothetical protein